MNFLERYGNIFLFLIVESFALFLVAQYNTKQNEIYLSSANLISGFIYENVSTVRNYFLIKNINDSLARENADLRTQLEASKYLTSHARGEVSFPLDTSTVRPDTTRVDDVLQKFRFITAEVINNSVARADNYITINAGSQHGVKPGMGVIASSGVVGIVRNVTPRYAQVMSILNSKTSISAMVRRNRYFGSLVWRSPSRNPKIMILESVPKHAEILRGDTIVTSGFSETFPGRLNIGRIVDFTNEKGSSFYTIKVELTIDMSQLQYVYVVENLLIEELKQVRQEPLKPTTTRRKQTTEADEGEIF